LTISWNIVALVKKTGAASLLAANAMPAAKWV